jgi:hypothetical protein
MFTPINNYIVDPCRLSLSRLRQKVLSLSDVTAIAQGMRMHDYDGQPQDP